MFQLYFEDKEKGGLFHATSEDWSKIVSFLLDNNLFSLFHLNLIRCKYTRYLSERSVN